MLIEKQYTGRNKWNQKIWEVTLVCDECSLSFVEDYKNTKKKLLKRTEHLCNACLSILTNKIAGDRMRKYKANLSKEQKKQQKKRTVKPQSETVLTLMTDLAEKIGKLDVAQLSDEDKESIRQALSALTQTIEDKLSGAD